MICDLLSKFEIIGSSDVSRLPFRMVPVPFWKNLVELDGTSNPNTGTSVRLQVRQLLSLLL